MTQALEREFLYNGLKLAALEWPGEGLPVLALHGWLDNALSFAPLAPYLADCHVVAVDLPGHGHSEHLPQSAHYHLADNLYWIKSVLDELGWERCILLGHSMGAAIASLTAAAMPQRVIGLSLIDGLGPLAFTPELEVQRLRQLFSTETEESVIRPFGDKKTAISLRQRYSRFPISFEAAALLTERNVMALDTGYGWRYDERLKRFSSHYYSEEQVQGILSAIERPSLLISGDKGALQDWEGFARRRAALPGLQHQIVAGGHHLHMESPEAVAEWLNRFYATLVR